jgi:hypothetical protein
MTTPLYSWPKFLLQTSVKQRRVACFTQKLQIEVDLQITRGQPVCEFGSLCDFPPGSLHRVGGKESLVRAGSHSPTKRCRLLSPASSVASRDRRGAPCRCRPLPELDRLVR